MTGSMRAILVLAVSCLTLLPLSACGPTGGRVPLTYQVVGGQAGSCAQSVGVFWFEDERGSSAIGRNQEEDLYPRSMGVTTWITNALVSELSARGCKAEAMSEGSPFAPDTVLSGEVTKVFLERRDLDLTLDMALRIELQKGEDTLLKKTYKGQWQRTTAPTEDVYVDMYRQGLADLLQEVADDVSAKLR